MTVIVISTLSWGIGLVVGFLLACAKLSAPRWVKIPVELYIWFFRSVPLMVLLVFVYNLPQLFPVTQPPPWKKSRTGCGPFTSGAKMRTGML